MKTQPLNTRFSIFKTLMAFALGLSSLTIASKPALSAEKVKLIYGPFNGRISVEALEKYADTGEITGEFRVYSKFLDRESLEQLRYWLSSRFQSDRVSMYKFAKSPEGEQFLTELGTAIKTHPERNGLYAIRSSLIEATDKPGESDGWTIIEAMHKFPSEDLQINTKDIFKLQALWSENEQQNQAAMNVFAVEESKTHANANQGNLIDDMP